MNTRCSGLYKLALLLEFASFGISDSGERVAHSYKLSKLPFSVLVTYSSHTRAFLLGVSSRYLALLISYAQSSWSTPVTAPYNRCYGNVIYRVLCERYLYIFFWNTVLVKRQKNQSKLNQVKRKTLTHATESDSRLASDCVSCCLSAPLLPSWLLRQLDSERGSQEGYCCFNVDLQSQRSSWSIFY